MKIPKPLQVVKIHFDRFGISFVECPRCENYIPNAKVGVIKCSVCNHEFKAVE